ncbi:hypothetical protein NDI37_23065 [Funiculus sociatus GB2-A5]|uniref:Uncharacterized protein n=1 Tax=Funiculus sociatus GB2-A5 TaxID=2933946 RepID=A0ABV0JVU0_9CYAN|nr:MULTISPECIES: hypothetical protein [unclassified Trichocoleus]MBD1904305.1 hypothetical protein [Trichocoleus sp. FACHB-832]MBD2065223.1 hypothetical protein [Trichocoleus sp. FACHB-6]
MKPSCAIAHSFPTKFDRIACHASICCCNCWMRSHESLMNAIAYSFPPNFSSNAFHSSICCCNCWMRSHESLMSAIASLLTFQPCFSSQLFGWLQTVRM